MADKTGCEERMMSKPASSPGRHPTKRRKKNSDSVQPIHAGSSVKDVESAKKRLKEKFLVEMPQDFFDFLEFCQELNTTCPLEALDTTLGLFLVGPYDVIMGRFDDVDESTITYHLHWRYYYDPPEFMTVIKGDDTTGFHIGYFRDDPKSLPSFVGCNKAEEGCEITVIGENLFAAVNSILSSTLKKTKEKSKQSVLKTLQTQLATKSKELNYSLDASTAAIKARSKKAVTKSFHKAGIVVPLDANEVGYRPLLVTDGELKRMLNNIVNGKTEQRREEASEELQETMSLIQFANDECDYGMGLELGIDLFCFGHERFHNTILQLLPLAYQLLGRNEYSEIIETHIKHRKRKSLSQISDK